MTVLLKMRLIAIRNGKEQIYQVSNHWGQIQLISIATSYKQCKIINWSKIINMSLYGLNFDMLTAIIWPLNNQIHFHHFIYLDLRSQHLILCLNLQLKISSSIILFILLFHSVLPFLSSHAIVVHCLLLLKLSGLYCNLLPFPWFHFTQLFLSSISGLMIISFDLGFLFLLSY